MVQFFSCIVLLNGTSGMWMLLRVLFVENGQFNPDIYLFSLIYMYTPCYLILFSHLMTHSVPAIHGAARHTTEVENCVRYTFHYCTSPTRSPLQKIQVSCLRENHYVMLVGIWSRYFVVDFGACCVPICASPDHRGGQLGGRRCVPLFIVQEEQGTGTQGLLCNFMSWAFIRIQSCRMHFSSHRPLVWSLWAAWCLSVVLLVSLTIAMLPLESTPQWNIYCPC